MKLHQLILICVCALAAPLIPVALEKWDEMEQEKQSREHRMWGNFKEDLVRLHQEGRAFLRHGNGIQFMNATRLWKNAVNRYLDSRAKDTAMYQEDRRRLVPAIEVAFQQPTAESMQAMLREIEKVAGKYHFERQLR